MKRFDIIQIIQNGGATLGADGKAVDFRRGYQVSKKDCYILDARHVNKILRAVNEILNGLQPGEYCGIWIDGGRAYVDISERIARKRDALKLGRALGQISIFDWRAKDCIYC